MDLLRISRSLLLICCSSEPAMAQAPAATTPRPVLIRGALVVDGSGAPARALDVRIVGATVRQMGQLIPSSSDSVVDARGLVLTPGLIDTQSHHDRGLGSECTALAAVSQGITTIVVGQDGWSNFPLADWFAQMEQRPAAVNVASYVGHGRLRAAILGDGFKRQATSAEVRHMAALRSEERRVGKECRSRWSPY